MTFVEFFQRATGNTPYPYQVRLAEADRWPDLLEAPTGAGKTEAIVLAWLWRRHHGPPAVSAATPRRLAYTLPMRVLVEQTRNRVHQWLAQLQLAEAVRVEILMGGETENDWDLYPEREAVLIGTQDMLLSRALNRGYALGRAHWPMPFGLLNNDCLWVFDEVQLMGSGLATTAQLAAFRQKLGTWGSCPSLWVSATLRPDWLSTVDFRATVPALAQHSLTETEWRDPASPLTARLHAAKALRPAKHTAEDPKKLAQEIWDAHQAGTLTLVVLNTVKKAIEVYQALQALAQPATKKGKKGAPEQAPLPQANSPELVLLHSRFRPPDRARQLQQALAPVPAAGRIVIATQVVEAGVDMSARTLFTELAPWPSVVQRVGRCNRYGEFETAQVVWIDVETKKSAPYEGTDLDIARAELKQLLAIGPLAVRTHLNQLADANQKKLYPYTPGSVLRHKDVVDMFDTTPDLTGTDVDVSRFIRETDDHDAQVFWRTWPTDDPGQPSGQAWPTRDELCPAPIGDLATLLKKKEALFRWDFLESVWQRTQTVVPGQIYLLPATAGHYATELGWSLDAGDPVPAPTNPETLTEGNDRDPYSFGRKIWQTLAAHTNQVVAELEGIVAGLNGTLTEAELAHLRHAARWHDWGKAYHVFQTALTAKAINPPPLPPGNVWGKSAEKSTRYAHPGFRHELASALGMVALGHADLACYLAAAHHGKVRVSIRSLPTEKPAPNGQRFARGVWEGETLPAVNLGGGVTTPAVTLSLAPMELGLSQDGQPSWTERVLNLLKTYGPFRLAYLETLLCAADRRASAHARPEVAHD